MTRRALSVFLALCAACVPASVAMASQPAGLAGELIVEAYPTPDLICTVPVFEAYIYFLDQPLGPDDTLSVDIAVVPFSEGKTWFTMDGIEGTFMGFAFSGGHVITDAGPVSGLTYNRTGWNDITFVIRPATQDFILTLNGAQAGPFPYSDFCPDQGGCYTANALRIDTTFPPTGGATAWFDTLSIAKDSPAGHQPLADRTFDRCGESGLVQTVGGATLTQKPTRFRPKR